MFLNFCHSEQSTRGLRTIQQIFYLILFLILRRSSPCSFNFPTCLHSWITSSTPLACFILSTLLDYQQYSSGQYYIVFAPGLPVVPLWLILYCLHSWVTSSTPLASFILSTLLCYHQYSYSQFYTFNTPGLPVIRLQLVLYFQHSLVTISTPIASFIL